MFLVTKWRTPIAPSFSPHVVIGQPEVPVDQLQLVHVHTGRHLVWVLSTSPSASVADWSIVSMSFRSASWES